jgi:predicted nucleic acid-binding protein
VRLVIADTSPINYLLLIGHVDILPALFDRVILPAAVWDELKHPKDVRPSSPFQDATLEALDAGEGAVIVLAI